MKLITNQDRKCIMERCDRENLDFHKECAAEMFSKKSADVTMEERAIAKEHSFVWLYTND